MPTSSCLSFRANTRVDCRSPGCRQGAHMKIFKGSMYRAEGMEVTAFDMLLIMVPIDCILRRHRGFVSVGCCLRRQR